MQKAVQTITHLLNRVTHGITNCDKSRRRFQSKSSQNRHNLEIIRENLNQNTSLIKLNIINTQQNSKRFLHNLLLNHINSLLHRQNHSNKDPNINKEHLYNVIRHQTALRTPKFF